VSKLPLEVIHYGANDPLTFRGGVETFARNLGLLFEKVRFMHPGNLDADLAARERIPVICDNHTALDWPADFPLIGFQHGVAAVKATVTRSRGDKEMAAAQAIAGKRGNILWVACAEWIRRTSAELYGSSRGHVIYHPVDMERFDGRLQNDDPKLILHDARSEHKGQRLVARLQMMLPRWRFEPLECEPTEVPDRMRAGRAFVHLSRYEGNSIVCNEAMAMDLPCLFTNVGLMQDQGGPTDIAVVDADEVFGDKVALLAGFEEFAASLEQRRYNPRAWMLEHATPAKAIESWRNVMLDFAEMSGWSVGL